ncbi:MAG: 30S ribosomal protein S6 [Micrococcales bacterium]|nr:30S ribosomal protein S6 [Micrococcales bacterium]
MSLRPYEIMIILDPDTEERAVAPALDKYLSVVTAQGGSIDNIDIWGRRRLAYDIRVTPGVYKSEGIYAVVRFAATPATTAELDRQLGLNEAVLRTKVMRAEPAKGRAAKAAAKAAARAAAKAADAPASAPAQG